MVKLWMNCLKILLSVSKEKLMLLVYKSSCQCCLMPLRLPLLHQSSWINVRIILNQNSLARGMLSEIDKLFHIIYFTFPPASATAERSFPSLRLLIKTYLRSTMISQEFNSLLYSIYVHKYLLTHLILFLFTKHLSLQTTNVTTTLVALYIGI